MAVINNGVYEDGVFEDGRVFADFTSEFVDRLDITNKIVFLKAEVTSFHPVDDLYPEVRSIRRIDESIRVMNIQVVTQGNEPAGQNFTPRRAVFNDGWRLGLENSISGPLSITGEMISDDGLSGAQIVKLDYLPSGVSLLVNYTPPSSEVILADGGGAAPTPSENADAVWSHVSRTLTEQATLIASQAEQLSELHEASFNRRKHDSGANTMTIYEADGTTPKHVFDSNADLSDITPQ